MNVIKWRSSSPRGGQTAAAQPNVRCWLRICCACGVQINAGIVKGLVEAVGKNCPEVGRASIAGTCNHLSKHIEHSDFFTSQIEF